MSIFRQGISLGPYLPPVPVDNDVERTILAHPVGAAPLVAALCRQLGIPDLIDREATWDPSRCILSPGERITALIINLICEERRPLYTVEDNFRKLDTELLFGEGIRPEHLNDDCLGRRLDAFWEIDPSQILRQVSSSLRINAQTTAGGSSGLPTALSPRSTSNGSDISRIFPAVPPAENSPAPTFSCSATGNRTRSVPMSSLSGGRPSGGTPPA